MELEVSAKLGADRYERTTEDQPPEPPPDPDLGHPAGTVELAIPKLHSGSSFPGWLLGPRRRAERALFAVVAEASRPRRQHPEGRCPRPDPRHRRDEQERGEPDLRRARSPGDGLPRAAPRRAPLPVRLARGEGREGPGRRQDRPDGDPHRHRGERAGRASGARPRGRPRRDRSAVALLPAVPRRPRPLWSPARHRRRPPRAPAGDRGDPHRCDLAALPGPSPPRHPRPRPQRGQGLVAADVRTIFAQPDGEAAERGLAEVADHLRTRFPKAAETLLAAAADVLASTTVPREHWSKVWSTNPLEQLHRELARRTDVVGIFPNRDALVRLVGALLAEQHDEWLTADRRYLPQASLLRLLGGRVNPTIRRAPQGGCGSVRAEQSRGEEPEPCWRRISTTGRAWPRGVTLSPIGQGRVEPRKMEG